MEEYAARTRLHADKLDEVVEGMLGSALGHKLSNAEKEQMKEMVRKQVRNRRAGLVSLLMHTALLRSGSCHRICVMNPLQP